ncbi:CoA-binding protein [Candidatus Pelagibacter sp.]|nr:CoA-binding protein [Candidatus Pelagibacter sp.]
MEKQVIDDKIKELFISSRVIALVGASNNKEKDSNKVMRFLQRAGFKVIPVNPTSINNFIHGEKVYGSLTDINQKVDIVDVFRPSKEAEEIANQTIKIGAQVLWLQLDVKSDKARDLVMKNKIYYISNKCIKIEYERLFRASD